MAVTRFGDSPSYTDISACSVAAQLVISQNKFPIDLIHSCKTETVKTNGNIFNIVEIRYGTAQDCPSGCFYDYYIGSVPEGKSEVIDLPIKSGTIVGDPKDYYPSPHNVDCNWDNLEDITRVELDLRDNKLGWKYIFNEPFECSWFENVHTEITMENTQINTGYEVTREWEGETFVYLENTKDTWVTDKMTSTEVGREEIVTEESF